MDHLDKPIDDDVEEFGGTAFPRSHGLLEGQSFV